MDGVVERVKEIATIRKDTRKKYMQNAKEVSEIALWENNIVYYKEAYSKALEKLISVMGSFPEARNIKSMEYRKFEVNQPTWNSVIVSRHLPDSLKDLETLSL